MAKPHFVLSLITTENDYQKQQAASAQEVANRLGFDLDIIFAENDSIMQSQQLLSVIQASGAKPDGIAFEPVSGTGLPQVAKAAVAAKIAWAVVNRSVDYVSSLRSHSSVPVFQVSADHVEVGRIQGRQMRALLPDGGLVLYIQGPTSVTAAEDRTRGLSETKPENIQLRVIKGTWTQESAYAAVSAWMRLSTSHTLPVAAVVAQNDLMAMGARRAFEELTSGAERDRWMNLLFLGCDGLPDTGKAWVHRGLLSATITLPETAGVALEMLGNAQRTGKIMPEMTFVAPASYPQIPELSAKRAKSGL